MSQVKVITDSNAFFADEGLVADLSIEVVPLTIQIGQHSFQEGVNLTSEVCLRRPSQDPGSV